MTTSSGQPIPQPIRPHVAPAVEDQSHRERFDAHELAMVLSHYDLGVIEQLRVHPRGSRRSPKLRIKSKRGEYLLKRRAPGHDDPYRVAFAHDLQLRLSQRGYPVPGLIGTRDENNSMLQFNGRAYEMFNYVHGIRFDRTARSAVAAGAALGRLHALLADHRSVYEPPAGSFHAAGEINAKMALIPAAVGAVEPGADRTALAQTAEFLRRAYHEAARRVEDAGFATWPRRVIHGDWHPGNLLYRDGRVVGVVDFDSARSEPRVVDVANAALQFSMHMDVAENPASWPDGLDVRIAAGIFHGYDQTSGTILSHQERSAAGWLMIEALIAESVVPIAATGSFARIAGSAFLYMIERKVKWIRPRSAKLAEPLKE